MLAVAYAYGKLNVYSKAALMYGSALEKFEAESDRLDESIKSIRKGHFLKALVREVRVELSALRQVQVLVKVFRAEECGTAFTCAGDEHGR